MKKNSQSQFAFFNPRVFLAFLFCSAGALLAMFSFAGPTPSSKAVAQATSEFKPMILRSFSNGVSPRIRDLPVVLPTTPTTWVAEGPRPLHPPQPLPTLPVHDPVQQTSPGLLAMPSPNLTFEGINQAGGCGNCIPPDPNGAVGPNHYVEMVNSSYAVYSKTGTLLAGPTRINQLWANLPGNCQQTNDGDPVVLYDHLANRWVLTQFTVHGGSGPYGQCIAVSTSPDPTGSYYVYDFDFATISPGVFHDYPKLGVWPDAYYMTTNEFPPNAQLSQGYGAFAFERDKMLLGQPARLVFFDLGTVNTMFAGALPSDVDGPLPPAGSPNYFVEVDDEVFIPPTDAMRIWKFHVDWSNTSNSTFGNNGQPDFVIPVPDFTPPECLLSQGVCIQQRESPYQLDALGDRIMFRLAYRNFGDHESFTVNHSVVADVRVGVRWYEVRGLSTTPIIYQTGTFAPIDQLHRWMGSIAMDRSGDIVVGYSTSSAADFPSIAYAGRLPGDTLGQMSQGEAQMFAGTGSENVAFYIPPVGRWGDYTDLTVDPSDGCTFWYVNEYFGAEGTTDPGAPWRTRIGSFKLPQCVPAPPLQLLSVVSRKVHGTAGIKDIALPLTGPRGVECRSPGQTGTTGVDYKLVFTFSNPVTSCGTASTGTVTPGPNSNQCTVNLTGVPNAQYITVILNAVVDSATGNIANNFAGTMGVLLGDVNANGLVNSTDTSQVQAQSGQPVTGDLGTGNYRKDVNANGLINSTDTSIVQSKSGNGLPSPP
jgi:Dockerin type I domain